jgi:hypothetical protein
MCLAWFPAKILDPRRFATATSKGLRSAAGLVAFVLLLSAHPSVARDRSIYTVNDVIVDETAESAAAARDIALSRGQAAAFQRLMNRIAPLAGHSRIPALSSAVLVDIVGGIDVEGEKTSPVRYIATLTVRFNQAATRKMLRDAGVPFAETPGKPLIVLPIYRAAGTLQLWDGANDWLRAWQALPPQDALIPLIVPRGDSADIADISPQQALNGAQARLTAIADRYRASGVVLAAATLRRNSAAHGSVLEIALSRFGSGVWGSTSVKSFSSGPNNSTEEFLRSAAMKIREEVAESWKQDNLIRFGEQRELVAVIPLSGLPDWVRLRERFSEIATLEKTNLMSLSLNEATVRFSYFGDQNQLVLAFAQRDMELSQGSVYWQLRMAQGSKPTTTGSAAKP